MTLQYFRVESTDKLIPMIRYFPGAITEPYAFCSGAEAAKHDSLGLAEAVQRSPFDWSSDHLGLWCIVVSTWVGAAICGCSSLRLG